MAQFDWDVEPIVDFLGNELLALGRTVELQVLKNAECSLYECNQQYDYIAVGLKLVVSQVDFRHLRPRLEKTKALFKELAGPAFYDYEYASLEHVLFVPKAQADASWRLGIEQPIHVSPEETSQIWKPGFFRLFLSHKAEIQKELHALKQHLLRYGIDTFIAHVEIEPNQIWQRVIEHGLQTSHALAAFHSPGFRSSAWCMQEVGWTLGRGVVVQSVLVGEAPYGFHGEPQGISVALTKPSDASLKIAKALRGEPRLEPKIFDGIAQNFSEVPTASEAWSSWLCFKELWPCPATHRDKIAKAFKGNEEAMKSYRAVPELNKWLNEEPQKPVRDPKAVAPSAEEYDPFADE